MNKKIRVASMFAGIGGICLGFKRAGFNIAWANEIDKYACTTYRKNFGDSYLVEDDIYNVLDKDIPNIDVLTAGFPCQPFSIAGYQKGFEDDRGNLFFEVLRVIKAKKPKVIFLENVKNLVTHDNKHTFEVITKSLEEEGYYLKYKVLNSCKYGNIPQNRERIYIVGFLEKDKYDSFEFPLELELTKRIEDIIDINVKVDDKYYYNESSKYYNMISETIIKYNTIYQLRRIYIRENKNFVCPTLTANMGTGGHNVPLIKDNYGYRKLTPRECLLFQGFPLDFIIPEGMSDARVYKQAGNAVTVTVIERIAKNIISLF